MAADLTGPVEPKNSSGKRYIPAVVVYATRYPKELALSNINTERVSEVLIEMFSRVGVPEEIMTDRELQFTSTLMNEVHRLLSIKHLPTITPYHAMGNGFVEKFNGTLKTVLKKMCSEQLQQTCKLAHDQLRKSHQKYKLCFDKHNKERKFPVGDNVLLLLPSAKHKLLMQWKGPYKVLGKIVSTELYP